MTLDLAFPLSLSPVASSAMCWPHVAKDPWLTGSPIQSQGRENSFKRSWQELLGSQGSKAKRPSGIRECFPALREAEVKASWWV